MKSIILGAFILSLFFAVAQSIRISPYRTTYRGSFRETARPASSVDTTSAFAAIRQTDKVPATRSVGLVTRVK